MDRYFANYNVPLPSFFIYFSLLVKQRYLLVVCMSQCYLSEFRVQTLRFENYESISCVTLSTGYGRRTGCHVTTFSGFFGADRWHLFPICGTLLCYPLDRIGPLIKPLVCHFYTRDGYSILGYLNCTLSFINFISPYHFAPALPLLHGGPCADTLFCVGCSGALLLFGHI